jgi:hypothetical protein
MRGRQAKWARVSQTTQFPRLLPSPAKSLWLSPVPNRITLIIDTRRRVGLSVGRPLTVGEWQGSTTRRFDDSSLSQSLKVYRSIPDSKPGSEVDSSHSLPLDSLVSIPPAKTPTNLPVQEPTGGFELRIEPATRCIRLCRRKRDCPTALKSFKEGEIRAT